jgi:hypothetical protein
VLRLAAPFSNGLDEVTLGNDGHLYLTGNIESEIDQFLLVAKVLVGTELPAWTNPVNNLDVNNDAMHAVSPIDVLLIINWLNSAGVRELPMLSRHVRPPAFLDSSADGFVSPIDALQIINFLNAASAGEAERGGVAEPGPWFLSLDPQRMPQVAQRSVDTGALDEVFAAWPATHGSPNSPSTACCSSTLSRTRPFAASRGRR